MRFLSILALSVFALTATAQSYTVKGKIDAKYNGKYIMLAEQLVYVDSAAVENGTFEFKRNVTDQVLGKVQIKGNKRLQADVIVYPGADILVDFTNNPVAVTDNGGLNDKRMALNEAVMKAGNAVNAKIQQLQSQGMASIYFLVCFSFLLAR